MTGAESPLRRMSGVRQACGPPSDDRRDAAAYHAAVGPELSRPAPLWNNRNRGALRPPCVAGPLGYCG